MQNLGCTTSYHPLEQMESAQTRLRNKALCRLFYSRRPYQVGALIKDANHLKVCSLTICHRYHGRRTPLDTVHSIRERECSVRPSGNGAMEVDGRGTTRPERHCGQRGVCRDIRDVIRASDADYPRRHCSTSSIVCEHQVCWRGVRGEELSCYWLAVCTQ